MSNNNIVDSIINRNFTESNDLLEAAVVEIMKTKLHEMKKMVAAKMTEQKMTPCGKVKSSTGEVMKQSVMKQRKGVVEEEDEKEKEKPKRANLPSWGGKKTLQRNVFRKPSDADVRRRLEKEIEDAQDKEDEYMREANLKQIVTKAKKFIGHKKRVSDAAAKAMDSDSWEKNLAKVSKVVKKND